jgi:hypothetical protein
MKSYLISYHIIYHIYIISYIISYEIISHIISYHDKSVGKICKPHYVTDYSFTTTYVNLHFVSFHFCPKYVRHNGKNSHRRHVLILHSTCKLSWHTAYVCRPVCHTKCRHSDVTATWQFRTRYALVLMTSRHSRTAEVLCRLQWWDVWNISRGYLSFNS